VVESIRWRFSQLEASLMDGCALSLLMGGVYYTILLSSSQVAHSHFFSPFCALGRLALNVIKILSNRKPLIIIIKKHSQLAISVLMR
jgi:hypothetical protein